MWQEYNKIMVFNKSSRVATATTPFDFMLFPRASPGPQQQHTFQLFYGWT